MFDLNLPQQIVIKNWRLQLVYNILLVIVGSAILCTFVLQKDFSTLVRLDVRPTLYINAASDFSGLNASGGTDLVCDQDFEVPREIEKVSGQRLAIASHQCVHRCNFGDRSQLQKYLNPRDAYHCLSVADLVRHESPTLAKMITSTLAWDLHEAMSSTTTPPTANANVSLYPWLAKMKVTFEFTFESRSQLSWYFGATPGRIRGDQSHAHVVFVDAHGRPTHVFRQPSHVTLELSDILKMATVPASSENFDKTMLYWGAWLESTITCYNDMGDLEFGLEKIRSLDIHASTASPVCAIQVKQVGRAVSHETHTKNSTIHVLSNVSIKITTSQSFMRLPSLWATIINLSSCVVVLQLPKSILRVLCSRMLGHLSLVYRQNLERSVDIAQYCAGWAMRVALIAANLYPMTPNTDEHLGYGAVPVRQLHRMLRLALGHHAALDEDDVHNILKYAFDEIGPQSRPKTYRKALTVVSKKEKFKGPYAPVQPLSSSAQLKIGHITELCISNDIVSFDAVAGLLDRRRPLGVLEKMFMPGKLLMPRTLSGSSSDTRLDSCSRPHGRSLMPGNMLGKMHTLSHDSAGSCSESVSTSTDTRHGSDLLLGMQPGPDMSACRQVTQIDGESVMPRVTQMVERLEKKNENLMQLVCQLREELEACKKGVLHVEHQVDSMHAKQLEMQGSRQTEIDSISINSAALNFKVDVFEGNSSALKKNLDIEIASVRAELSDTCAKMQSQLDYLSKQGERPSMHGDHSSSTDVLVTHQIIAGEEDPVQRWFKDAMTPRSPMQNHHSQRSVLGSCPPHGGSRTDSVNLRMAPRNVLHNLGTSVVEV